MPTQRRARSRTFEEVLAQIEHRIATMGLTVGDRLPGERQLAEQLQVSRSSVREALRVLETLGVLSSQVGRGPDAGAVLTSHPTTPLTDLLRLNLGLATLTEQEIIATRLMIEQWSAAHHSTAASLRTMGEALAAMDTAAAPEEFVDQDIAFHVALVDAAGNRLNSAIMRALRNALRQYAVEAVTRLGHTRDLQADHRRIYEAIAAGDTTASVTAVTQHLARAYPSTAIG
ncbi:FadR/GntR family transcriptional regulator [Acrocarpospora catenulata]|uniref:FadR/GntR family transcriptional regulator n=1 Tax=Acrocarpospora catenulata TaxID=2836182 RepID=UPI0027DF0EB9|nr:FCD domain-containing protein [Acrocarpospora catenulata]